MELFLQIIIKEFSYKKFESGNQDICILIWNADLNDTLLTKTSENQIDNQLLDFDIT